LILIAAMLSATQQKYFWGMPAHVGQQSGVSTTRLFEKGVPLPPFQRACVMKYTLNLFRVCFIHGSGLNRDEECWRARPARHANRGLRHSGRLGCLGRIESTIESALHPLRLAAH
jgi:hypothetical protein